MNYDAVLERALRAERQLKRANRIIGWMMQYVGRMCPPQDGLYDLNIHCCENHIPQPGDEVKGRPIGQHYNQITE